MKSSTQNQSQINSSLVGIYFVAVVLLLLNGCGERENAIAKVNDKVITENEFDAYAKFKRMNISDEAKRKNILNEYLDREALADTIQQQDVLDNASIEAELNEFRKEMLISRYFQVYLQDKVSDDAVRNFYVANEKDYQVRKIHVAHVLIRTNRNMGEAERQAKMTTAQEVHSKLKAGEDFGKIAKDYSEDTVSAKKGGDLGWMNEGAVDKTFSEKAFSMKVDEISEPIETPFGFHVIKVLEEPRVETKSFETVKGNITYQLRNQAKEAELERLRGISKVTQLEK